VLAYREPLLVYLNEVLLAGEDRSAVKEIARFAVIERQRAAIGRPRSYQTAAAVSAARRSPKSVYR
jgi:hypothetical protein